LKLTAAGPALQPVSSITAKAVATVTVLHLVIYLLLLLIGTTSFSDFVSALLILMGNGPIGEE
jgi:hypothetical protein